MKKIIYFFIFFISVNIFAQKVTEKQAADSRDAKVLAAFIKENPDHPRTPEFKRKLAAVIIGDKPKEQQEKIAKPVVKPLNTEKLKEEIKASNSTSVKSSSASTAPAKNTEVTSGAKTTSTKSTGVSEKNKQTAALLTHMFNNDPNSKEAYVQIVNKSKCNLIVKFSGKKFYNLTVPANNENFIMVDKGKYTLTSSVCDAKYSASKNIVGDISVTLNSPQLKGVKKK